MVSNSRNLFFDSNIFGSLSMDVPNRMAVVEELGKLEKTRGQLSDKVIAEVDSLHEPRMDFKVSGAGDLVPICAECWTDWPCATHRIIYEEDKTNCVHSI